MNEKWHHKVNEYTIWLPQRNGKKFYCTVTDLRDRVVYTTRDHKTADAAIADADAWCVSKAPKESAA